MKSVVVLDDQRRDDDPAKTARISDRIVKVKEAKRLIYSPAFVPLIQKPLPAGVFILMVRDMEPIEQN